MIPIFPEVIARFGPIVITDTVVVSAILSLLLVVGLRITLAIPKARRVLEIAYDALEANLYAMVDVDIRPLVPLILTLWLFIGVANLVGVVPGVSSPTRDLSLAAALALIGFVAGHVHAIAQRGARYLRRYVEPTPLLLPFNLIGELSRTIALALRLFGNMLSGTLIAAIAVYLAGALIPVPLLLLGVLTSLVQAYIFGVLTLVFAASSLEVADRPPKAHKKGESTS